MIKLVPVTTLEQVEWLRVHRNDPKQYKYFRQDAPITPEKQAQWWRTLDKNKVKLFIVHQDDKPVGYVGFNPFNQYAMAAEFGIFVLPEVQGKGVGREALLMLLKKGFTEYNLRTIYSDVLDYPRENRWDFYASLGFVKYPEYSQNTRYKKQGRYIPSIKFFMTRDMWMEAYGNKPSSRLGAVAAAAARTLEEAKGKGGSVHSGSNDLHSVA